MLTKSFYLLNKGDRMKANLIKVNCSLWHVVGGIRVEGVHKNIRGDISGIKGDVSNIRGNVSSIRGDVSSISGNMSGIRGDVSGIRGDVDLCELTEVDRYRGVSITKLIVN